MTATTVTVTNVIPQNNKGVLLAVTAACDSTDTFTVDLTKYGSFSGIIGFVHTTTGSVVVQEQPTTSVSSGTLTVTVGGSSVTGKIRHYWIFLQ